jgi:hypothetical protein
MEDLLDKVIEELGYDSLLCVKYVDDLLMIVTKEEVETQCLEINYNQTGNASDLRSLPVDRFNI